MIRTRKQRRHTWARLGGLGLVLGLALHPSPAAAWDPSSTHQGLLESGVVRSAVHLRWMDASELERGLFTALRVDPGLLEPDWLRLLELTMRAAHEDIGARPLGGPGTCPSADAPPETQRYCIDRNLWEHDALGWIRLGMVAEVTPSARHLHHFVDREDPESPTWTDDELPASVLRRRARVNGQPLAGVATRTNFAGSSTSAVAWLDDTRDILAPAQTYRHLTLASLAPSQAERDHYLALALIGVGALVHVVQDLSVPAHARGDVSAFHAQLSPAVSDRGLPLQEFVRVEYGRRSIPGYALPDPSDEPPSGVPLADSLVAHIIGGPDHRGLAELAGRHFLSESSVPAPAFLADTLSPSEAATKLLGEDHHLDPREVDGAILSPWPAQRGYVLSATGRALAAFDTDEDGRIRPYLDEACYRDQALQLLPAAIDTTRSLFDLIWPAWPTMRVESAAVELDIPAWSSAELHVLVEDDQGERRELSRQPLEIGASNRVALAAGELAAGERIYLVLEATRDPGPPIVLEQILPSATPEPTPLPTPPEPDADPQRDPAEPAPGDPDDAEPSTPDETPADPGDDPADDGGDTDSDVTDDAAPAGDEDEPSGDDADPSDAGLGDEQGDDVDAEDDDGADD